FDGHSRTLRSIAAVDGRARVGRAYLYVAGSPVEKLFLSPHHRDESSGQARQRRPSLTYTRSCPERARWERLFLSPCTEAARYRVGRTFPWLPTGGRTSKVSTWSSSTTMTTRAGFSSRRSITAGRSSRYSRRPRPYWRR